MTHSYPSELARVLLARWGDLCPLDACEESDPLPELPILEEFLSICYQASLLRDENRQVTFRIVLADPERFPEGQGPPESIQRLLFRQPRPLNELELRRLSGAADYNRTIIGVYPMASSRPNPAHPALDVAGLTMWGLIQTGPRWLYSATGGRTSPAPLPPCLSIGASGPGRLELFKGNVSIGRIDGGRISFPVMDAFKSAWLGSRFSPIRTEIMTRHETARRERGQDWPTIDGWVSRTVSQHAVKRIISVIRGSGHGGTMLILPPDQTEQVMAGLDHIFLKYPLVTEPWSRFITLNAEVLNTLAAMHASPEGAAKTVGLEEYRTTDCPAIVALDEAVFELSYLMASLTAVDGAVILSHRMDIIGFGGEISGDLPGVLQVARALDVEADEVAIESTESVGTRHRSVYRLCNAYHDAFAIVVSQDGEVRFVMWKDGMVTYWEHQATGS